MLDHLRNMVAMVAHVLRDDTDERGAESSEVILVLVLLVIGLAAAWAFLRKKITGQTTKIGNCIGGTADNAAKC